MNKLEKVISKLRLLISLDNNCPLQILFETGAVKIMALTLTEQFDPFSNLQNETLWVFINILAAADKQMLDYLSETVFQQEFLRLLKHEKPRYVLIENFLWCFCNYIQSQPELTYTFLDNGVLETMAKCILHAKDFTDNYYPMYSTVVWSLYTITDILRDKILPYVSIS